MLFTIAWLLLQRPGVQTFVVKKITDHLSQTLQTNVAVGSVDIRFFKTVVLKDIYIEDQQKDTLLFAGELNANIGIFSLFSKNIYLNQLSLQNAVIQINRQSPDSLYNFEFLVDAFKPTTTSTPDPNAPKWTFGLDKIQINQIHFYLVDSIEKADYNISIGEFYTQVKLLNIDEQKLEFKEVNLTNTIAHLQFLKKESTPTSVPSEDPENNTLNFPNISWELTIDQFSGSNNHFVYSNTNFEKTQKNFNVQHLNLNSIALNLTDFLWKNNQITGAVENLSFRDHSGFVLENFEVQFTMDTSKIELKNILLKTPNSSIENHTKLSFDKFDDLSYFADKVTFESHFEKNSGEPARFDFITKNCPTTSFKSTATHYAFRKYKRKFTTNLPEQY